MTYAELQAALHAYVHREDQPTTNNEANALALGAAAIVRVMTPREAWASVVLSAVDGVATLPADFIMADAVSVDGVGALEFNDPRDWSEKTSLGIAWDSYTIGGGVLYVPPRITSVRLAYYGRPAAISGGQSNWLSIGYPDVWLHAAVAEQFRFNQDPESAGMADAYWQGLAGSALAASRAGAQSGGAIRMKGR